MTILDKIKSYAFAAHANQTYGAYPYSKHLEDVAEIVKPYGELCQVVAYCHDILEDTDVTPARLDSIIGVYASSCVNLITDPPGANRKERKQKLYDILTFTHQKDHPEAFIVKAADRLANVRCCASAKDLGMLKMYKKEQHEFWNAVYRPGLCDKIWTELGELMR